MDHRAYQLDQNSMLAQAIIRVAMAVMAIRFIEGAAGVAIHDIVPLSLEASALAESWEPRVGGAVLVAMV